MIKAQGVWHLCNSGSTISGKSLSIFLNNKNNTWSNAIILQENDRIISDQNKVRNIFIGLFTNEIGFPDPLPPNLINR